MALQAGIRLGPYEIAEPLGAGGMGEVYRAHDSRLGRDVAVKVLPPEFSADASRLARFEQEARAVAALNHPNIVSVFDIGEHHGTRYIVSELLEGETLRSRLSAGLLPLRRIQDYALQIAQGLAAAHGKGIVHRDLKPDNIFLSKDGRAKILDFGLAKHNALSAMASESGATVTAMPHTSPGMMLGTVGYMSPEQVRGTVADHRADIFSFGAVLHEMLSGARPFQRDTSAETMTAILKDEPPELVSDATRVISPALERITRRCLEKDPEQRFQSARDLAFALEAMSGASTVTVPSEIAKARRRLSMPLQSALGAGAVVLVIAVAVIGFSLPGRVSAPTFHQLTASRGFVRMARFTSDGQTVVFAGAWNGEPLKLFFERSDANGFSPLTIPEADLLSVSSTGELAISLRRRFTVHHVPVGTLARTSLSGGAPREVLDGVEDADWAPDGASFAVARAVGNKFRLEYPVGKVLFENSGYISHIRLSHRGDKIAFMDHAIFGDDRGTIAVVDINGKKTTLTREWPSEQGLAWAPDDSEIWYTAADEQSSNFNVLRSVTLSGKDRVVLRSPISLRIHDIARDGTVLLGTDVNRNDVTLGDVSTGKLTDLTWFDNSWNQSLSPDGKWLVFSTQEAGSNTNYSVFMRGTDGSAALRLGDGGALGFSPDGKWVVAALPANPDSLELLPTGAGEIRILKSQKVRFSAVNALWTLDGKSFVVTGYEPGRGERSYLQSVDGGEPRPITPEGVVADVLSPDGQRLLAHDSAGKVVMCPLQGGERREVRGANVGDVPVQWLQDGRTLILRAGYFNEADTFQVDVDSGVRKPWKHFAPADKVGLIALARFLVSPDGGHYLTADWHLYSTLFIVKGLK